MGGVKVGWGEMGRIFSAPLEKEGRKRGKVGGGKKERNREHMNSYHLRRVHCGLGAFLYYL